MLETNSYFDTCKKCRSLGLRSLSVVNGTRITSTEMASRVLEDGPDEISISLDSEIEAIHDKMRGSKGAFAAAVRALRLLVKMRSENEARFSRRIYAMALIYDLNYKTLDAFYNFVLRDIGADKLKLNFIQPTFGLLGGVDKFLCEHGHLDPEAFGSILLSCDLKYNLDLNPVWIQQVVSYFKTLQRSQDLDRGWRTSATTSEHICNSGERNIMVDLDGIARLCFATRFGGHQLRKKGDLKDFWNSRRAQTMRSMMASCNALCGISHSVRRESGTMKKGK